MKRVLTLVTLAVMAAAGHAVAIEGPKDPRTGLGRTRGLIPPAAAGAEAIAAFDLDADMYASTRGDLGDLRIFRAGAAVPHLVERAVETRTRTAREPQPARQVALHEEADNRIEVVFELTGADPRAEGFEIITPLRDFDRTVCVSAGPDGIAWDVVVPEARVCDYTRFMDFAQREVTFPAVNKRFVRLEITAATAAQTGAVMELTREFRDGQPAGEIRKTIVEQQAFRMNEVRFWRTRAVEEYRGDIQREYAVTGLAVSRNEKQKSHLQNPLTASICSGYSCCRHHRPWLAR
ncbi:MAG: hypothetical protein ABIF71_10815 [Planctomycetota bacterium]